MFFLSSLPVKIVDLTCELLHLKKQVGCSPQKSVLNKDSWSGRCQKTVVFSNISMRKTRSVLKIDMFVGDIEGWSAVLAIHCFNEE